MISTQVRKLTLSIDDFDRQLLPASVRGGKPAVRHDAMSDFVRKQFRKLGGRVQKVEYTSSEMQVTWLQDLHAGDPIHPIADMLNRGQRAEGVMLLRLLQSDQPDNPLILYNLGMALSDMGKLDEAIAHLSRLAEVDPTHVNGRVALGVALMRRGDDERGIEALEQAAALEPANPWAQRNLGAALAESGRVYTGIEHCARPRVSRLTTTRHGMVWGGHWSWLATTTRRTGPTGACWRSTSSARWPVWRARA